MARWWTRIDQSPCRTSRIGEHRARFLKQTHQPLLPPSLPSLSLSLSLSRARAHSPFCALLPQWCETKGVPRARRAGAWRGPEGPAVGAQAADRVMTESCAPPRDKPPRCISLLNTPAINHPLNYGILPSRPSDLPCEGGRPLACTPPPATFPQTFPATLTAWGPSSHGHSKKRQLQLPRTVDSGRAKRVEERHGDLQRDEQALEPPSFVG